MSLAHWLPALALLLLAVLARIMDRSWLAPGAFFAALWTAYFALPLIGAPGYFIASLGALWLLVLLVALTVAGCMLGIRLPGSKSARPRAAATANDPAWRWLPGLTGAMALASLVVIPGALAYGETGWRDLLTLDTFFEHIRRTSDKRIGEFVREPLPLRLGLIALYASALAGGALFRVAERRSLRMLALLPFGIVLAYVALTSTKAPAMFVAYLWLAGWLVASLGRSGQSFSILQPRYVALFTLFWVAALPLTYLFTAIRRRELGTIYSDEAASAIDTYFFSHLATFSHWFHTQAFNPDPLNWGRYTFAGLADFLGLSPRLPGVYETVVTVGPRGETSNLFTVFRGLISDFSLPGAMLLLFAFGLLAGLAWRRLTAGDARMAPWVALFYLFAFTSNLYSPFLFNSIIGAWVLFALALWLPARLGQRLKAAT